VFGVSTAVRSAGAQGGPQPALGFDVWIGLPDSEHGRVAEMRRPSAMPDLGPLTPIKRAAFLEPWSSPTAATTGAWRRAENPLRQRHATADSLAA